MWGRVASLGAERFAALLVGVFAIAQFYAATDLSLTEEFTIGPAAMPLIYAVGLLVFAAILWVKASSTAAAAESAADASAEPVTYAAGARTGALLVLFAGSIHVVGFLVGTVLFSFLYLAIVMRWSLLKAAIFALAWGGALYYGFGHLLEVQLEPGSLFDNW